LLTLLGPDLFALISLFVSLPLFPLLQLLVPLALFHPLLLPLVLQILIESLANLIVLRNAHCGFECSVLFGLRLCDSMRTFGSRFFLILVASCRQLLPDFGDFDFDLFFRVIALLHRVAEHNDFELYLSLSFVF